MRLGVGQVKEEALREQMRRLGIREQDLVERFIRSSGPGGQNVNKVETGVYLRHPPSGIEVKVVQERSQALNRFLARRILTDRLEARVKGRQSVERARIAKLRRQKRRRSRRAREKVLDAKRRRAALKELRGEPSAES
jgi:protein subunit release factor B